MGRICSWCGAFLQAVNVSSTPVSHALCAGCLEDLKEGLSLRGLAVAQADEAPRAH